jgi:hypothetical protein
MGVMTETINTAARKGVFNTKYRKTEPMIGTIIQKKREERAAFRVSNTLDP